MAIKRAYYWRAIGRSNGRVVSELVLGRTYQSNVGEADNRRTHLGEAVNAAR